MKKYYISKKVIICLLAVSLTLTGCSQNTASTEEDIQAKLQEYAELTISHGLNVQPGDVVAIDSSAAAADFTCMCIDAAYEAGASNVLLYWSDPRANASRYKNASDDILSKPTGTYEGFMKECAENDALSLLIDSPDPTACEDVDPKKMQLVSAANSNVERDYDDKVYNNEIPWCIVCYPNTAWAELAFPDKKGDEAVNALLDAILDTVYVTGDGTADETWDKHIDEMQKRADKLNSYDFKSLHYKNSSGTDVTVEMPKGHIWVACSSTTPEGQEFVANMPSEEIFSSPLKTGVNGTLAFAKPLVINGKIVENGKLTLKDGKIIEATATKGEDVLIAKLDTDEGSRYLGEISLVPYDSPISNSGLLFYETLYDENASCHFAFGSAYNECIKGGISMTEEELLAHGLNQSDTHIDFMVGTEDLSIIGTTRDGKEIVIFKDGNFAF